MFDDPAMCQPHGVEALGLRALNTDDRDLLLRATVGNLNWQAARFSRVDVETRPEFARYVELRPERGDFGFVAQGGDLPMGVAWALFLPAHDRGYGFVEPTTPEVSLWVRPAARSRGLGRRLLRALQAESRRRGLSALSLSVEKGNRARNLYVREGFADVRPGSDDGVMLWTPKPPHWTRSSRHA